MLEGLNVPSSKRKPTCWQVSRERSIGRLPRKPPDQRLACAILRMGILDSLVANFAPQHPTASNHGPPAKVRRLTLVYLRVNDAKLNRPFNLA